MRKKLGKSSKKCVNYYPFGMPMPNRNMEGNYRYGYQGEYAEKEEIGSTNSFQLRLWDARIGRWMSPDPYNQFFSPYLGMGNNPVVLVDPDGGCVVGVDCPDTDEFNWMPAGTEVLDEVVLTSGGGSLPLAGMKWLTMSTTGGGNIDFSKFDYSSVDIGNRYIHKLQTKNSEDAINAYRDFAQSTAAEWKIAHHDDGQYTLATQGLTDLSPSNKNMGLENSKVHYSIHSHPDTAFEDEDWGDGVGKYNGRYYPNIGRADWDNVINGRYNEKRTFIYFPDFNQVYEYTKQKPRIKVRGGLNSFKN